MLLGACVLSTKKCTCKKSGGVGMMGILEEVKGSKDDLGCRDAKL